MGPPPNELYSAFSFIGFVCCVIPFYWHFKARNASTCLYLIWTGLGCLLQFINSIVWNRNMVNRVPVYCDISTHVQIALNVAVPAASLCINRQLYRVARMKTVGFTDVEKRRNLIYDLLIGIGIPFLQMIAQYVVSGNRYDIFEDFGPLHSIWDTPITFVLFFAWPVAIGTVSLFFCVMAIYAFYKRRRNHMQLISNVKHDQYLRLMAISIIEIVATIPIGTFYIVCNAKSGVVPWVGWARVHRHYSEVIQIPGIIWRNDPVSSLHLELFRWSLVGCAFVFFALFGFTGEARGHYYCLYQSLARCLGKTTSTPHGLAPSPDPYAKRNCGIANHIMVQRSRNKDNLSISESLTDVTDDQISTLSISTENTLDRDSMTLHDAESDKESDIVSFYTAKSFDESRMEYRSQRAPSPPPDLPQTFRPELVVTIAGK